MACIEVTIENRTAPHLDVTASHVCNIAEGKKGEPTEFSFRATNNGKAKDGAARIKRLKGNSVVWNNAVRLDRTEGNNASISVEGGKINVTPTGAYPGCKIIPYDGLNIIGHKYAVLVSKKSDSQELYVNFGGFDGLAKNAVFESTKQTYYCTIYAMNQGASFTLSNIVICDLTKMFGAGNEPTTIEEYNARKPIVEDEYAYNEGEVIHMNVDAVKSVGLNAWDEEWEKGAFDVDTGANYDSSQIRSKNLIPVVSGASYKISVPQTTGIWIMFLNSKGNIVAPDNTSFQSSGMSINVKGSDPRSIIIPHNAAYMRFYAEASYGDTYNHDICINISDSEKNGLYQPYWQDVKSLEVLREYFPNGMRSAGTAHDEIRYNKATQKWEVVKRIEEVDLGTCSWAKGSSLGTFYFEVPLSVLKDAAYSNNLLCGRYAAWSGEKALASLPDKSLMLYNGASYPLLGVRDSAYADAASFKAAMQGVILYYELANPIVTEIDEPLDLYYRVASFGTEEALAEYISAPFSADIVYP